MVERVLPEIEQKEGTPLLMGGVYCPWFPLAPNIKGKQSSVTLNPETCFSAFEIYRSLVACVSDKYRFHQNGKSNPTL